ncbi:MAG: phosphoglycerate kinase [Legionellales bacterium RIFCSPHIGHO2_12_FULL_35_11]|nr:MAG: phosphoglycerate kinase [Legionellales bacterium RIFCSPHIGHO2_12_FULL_35_11]
MSLLSMCDVDLRGKRVLIREDLNVPIKDGIITSDQRLQAAIPTIQMALESGASVIVMSHLGRPAEGVFDKNYSLEPVANYLAQHLNYPVRFATDYLEGLSLEPGELVLCENVRFNNGETDNDPELSKKLANLCDIFIMDAFGTAHRAQASTCGVAKYAKIAVAGPLLMRELKALERVLKNPEKPIIGIIGGAKVSSKLTLLKQIVKKVDVLIPGGGIANTFLKASGKEIGVSLCENDLLTEANEILELAKEAGCSVVLPTDVVVGKSFQKTCPAYNKSLAKVAIDDMIMDVGPETVATYIEILESAKTIIWNGPLGVFEFPQFSYGTRALAIAVANSEAFSIAGGGDTLAAIDMYNLTDQLSYISTGGGAFLEYLEGKKLPSVAILEERHN